MFHPLLVKQAGGLAESEVRRLLPFVPKLNKPAILTALLNEREASRCNAMPGHACSTVGRL